MNDHRHALPAGYRLQEYRIERVLGSGGFGITYYAIDLNLDKPVAVKEYLPNEFALRTDTVTVRAKSDSDQEDYEWGLKRFLDEARTLARFRHPHLNEVYRFFEGNGTAYLILDYIEGETLSQLLNREGRLDAVRLRRLLDELLSGLEVIHAAGYVHRDIKPGNIMLREDGSAVLLDFGAARQAVGQRSKSITSILTPGYAPIEQYQQSSESVGPWSDLYSLGMVAYRCLSGVSESVLLDAVSRARLASKGQTEKDLLPAVDAGKGRYDERLLKAVDWAIKVDEERRPPNVLKMRGMLSGGDVADVQKPGLDERATAGSSKVGKQGLSVKMLMLCVALVAGVGGGVGWVLLEEHKAEVAAKLEEEARRKAEEQRKAEAEAKRKAEEQRKAEEDAKRKAEEQRKAEAEAKRKAEEQRKAEEDAKRKAEEQRRVEEEEKRKAEAEAEAEAEAKRKVAAQAEREHFSRILGRQPSPRFSDANGGTDLHTAAAMNSLELAKYLLDAGATVDAQLKDDWEPYTDELRRMLRELTGKNTFDGWVRSGETPLHIAALANAREVAEYLVGRGADVNAKGNSGNTPLHRAAWENSSEVAEYLVDRGADINAKNDGGVTPLHQAAWGNAREVAEYLVDRGADINAKNNSGNTPLHYAAFGNAREVAEYLVDRGADINAKNNSGDTPLWWAERFHSTETAEYLRLHGGTH